jgi:hypothetical protein
LALSEEEKHSNGRLLQKIEAKMLKSRKCLFFANARYTHFCGMLQSEFNHYG